MIALGILLFLVLVIGSRHAKKQAAGRKPVPQRRPAPVKSVKLATPKHVQQKRPERQPELVTVSLVERHFGTGWQQFLAGQAAQLNLSNPYIRHTMALCYERLSSDEFLNLLQSFVSPVNRVDDYGLLYSGVYQLARSGRFVESDILSLLRDLPEQCRILRIQEAVAPPIVATSLMVTEGEEVQAEKALGSELLQEAVVPPLISTPVTVAEVQAGKASGREILQMLKALPAEYRAHRVQIVGETPILPTEDGVIDIETTVTPIPYEERPFVGPVWSHHYVYSASELKQATAAQQEFYTRYKTDFLKGHHWDLQGNTNYGFILLFELLADYQRHKDLDLFERQLRDLEISCPRTRPYAKSNLLQLMRATGDFEGVMRLDNNVTWDWREKYIHGLKLNTADTALLNEIWLPSSQFIQIEFCARELVRLYLGAMHLWNGALGDKKAELEFLGDLIARKQNRYRNGSSNYQYTLEHCGSTIAAYVLRYCESMLRAHLGHNRKVNVAGYLDHVEVQAVLQERVMAFIEPGMAALLALVPTADESVEMALNAISPTRWKTRLELSAASYQQIGLVGFRQAADQELRLNVRNPSLDIIFQELVKFLAGQDKPAALQYHLRYSHYCFGIKNADPKPMPKNLQKLLFKTEEQQSRFESLIEGLKAEQNLADLMPIAADFYLPVRKKIQLDPSLISQAEQRYEGTVEQLNEYLQEEEPVIVVASPVVTTDYAVTLTAAQNGLLDLFTQNQYQLDVAAVETYCQSAGAIRSALINAINENCYELLDDLLIEEEDDQYTINPTYYQQLLAT
jgi:hypothetical protein